MDHTALLELRSELKVQVETLQFRLQQSNQGVSVEQTTTDTGNYSEENRAFIFAFRIDSIKISACGTLVVCYIVRLKIS